MMMTEKHILLDDDAATVQLGVRLVHALNTPALITFTGPIGAGKTTLIRAMLRAHGVSSAIKSPTYTLVESYDCAPCTVHHFDLYRIHDPMELEFIGFREYLGQNAVCLVEWPEHGGGMLGKPDLQVSLEPAGDGRHARMKAESPRGEQILEGLEGGL